MTDGEALAIRVVIRGRVQGVGFRAWLQREAERNGVSGWARNDPDGSVEAVLAGPPSAVDAVLGSCREGPRLARVDEVEAVAADENELREVQAGTFRQRRGS